jgi:hypothetical protein
LPPTMRFGIAALAGRFGSVLGENGTASPN